MGITISIAATSCITTYTQDGRTYLQRHLSSGQEPWLPQQAKGPSPLLNKQGTLSPVASQWSSTLYSRQGVVSHPCIMPREHLYVADKGHSVLQQTKGTSTLYSSQGIVIPASNQGPAPYSRQEPVNPAATQGTVIPTAGNGPSPLQPNKGLRTQKACRTRLPALTERSHPCPDPYLSYALHPSVLRHWRPKSARPIIWTWSVFPLTFHFLTDSWLCQI